MCGASNPVVVKVCMPPPLPPPPSPTQEKICKLDALRLLLRPFVGQIAIRIIPILASKHFQSSTQPWYKLRGSSS